MEQLWRSLGLPCSFSVFKERYPRAVRQFPGAGRAMDVFYSVCGGRDYDQYADIMGISRSSSRTHFSMMRDYIRHCVVLNDFSMPLISYYDSNLCHLLNRNGIYTVDDLIAAAGRGDGFRSLKGVGCVTEERLQSVFHDRIAPSVSCYPSELPAGLVDSLRSQGLLCLPEVILYIRKNGKCPNLTLEQTAQLVIYLAKNGHFTYRKSLLLLDKAVHAA